jgi:hypothetical protein
MIFEGTTGRKETELRYHDSRPYGWFGLSDVDADGQSELVTIGDFQSHIDVLEFDAARPEAERLSVKWRRDIEQNIEERNKWPQVPPVANVPATTSRVVVCSTTPERSMARVVFAATDGKRGSAALSGSADVDGDGAAELFRPLPTANGAA